MLFYTIKKFDFSKQQIACQLIFNPISGTQPVVIQLPAWTPGSYTMRNFSSKMLSINAFDDEYNKPLGIEKLDLHCWVVRGTPSRIRIEYTLLANDQSYRGLFLDAKRALLELAACCLLPEGMHQHRCVIQISPQSVKESVFEKKKSLFTTLPCTQSKSNGFGTFESINYQTLIDNPIVVGELKYYQSQVNSVKHQFVVCGNVVLRKHFIKQINNICQTVMRQFGCVPFPHYAFIIFITDTGHGGLEHSACASIQLPSKAFESKFYNPRASITTSVLSLFAHEYIHAWIVKRVTNYKTNTTSLISPIPTTNLWFFEGFTHYYDILVLVRAGVISKDRFLILFAKELKKYSDCKALSWQSPSEASFDSWIRYYHPHSLSVLYDSSYYLSGMVVAFCLDTHVRECFDKSSLDQFIKHLAIHKSQINETEIYDHITNFFDLTTARLIQKLTQSRGVINISKSLDQIGLVASNQKGSFQLKIKNTNKLHNWIRVT
ncbi:MAG: hypothetical protein QM538_01055 [Methylacidiphilales bacterium]|nr:hypothetical protein [Candidatus Methylacidiphilales bacterium]